jgi:hypothetical protein
MRRQYLPGLGVVGHGETSDHGEPDLFLLGSFDLLVELIPYPRDLGKLLLASPCRALKSRRVLPNLSKELLFIIIYCHVVYISVNRRILGHHSTPILP